MIGAVTPERAHQLKREWREIRRRWVIRLAERATVPPETLEMLTPAERRYVETTMRLRALYFL